MLIRIQFFDSRFPAVAGGDAVLLKAYLSAVLSHFQPVQYQAGVGQVIDLDPGRTVGFQFSLPIQRVGLHHNTAAADAEARDFHIADRNFICDDLYRLPLVVCPFRKQAPLLHLVQNALALLHVSPTSSRS